MSNLARTFSALADETRLDLVEHLIASGEQSAGALCARTEISAPAVSRHLKVLHEAGLLQRRVAGTHRFYSVRPEAMAQLAGWITDKRAFWAASLDRLDALMAEESPEGEE